MIWCLRRHQIIHVGGFFCTTMWLLNFLLVKKKNLGAGAVGLGGKWQMGRRGILPPPGCPAFSPHPSSFPPSPPDHHHPTSSLSHPAPSTLLSGGFECLQALPPLQTLGCLHKGLASSSTRFQNNDRFEIINKFKNSDRYHKLWLATQLRATLRYNYS